MYVQCEQCKGKRFNRETLEVKYKDLSIADVLAMSVDAALAQFKNHQKISDVLYDASRRGTRLHPLLKGATRSAAEKRNVSNSPSNSPKKRQETRCMY